jgi:hypothetical protein
MALARSPLRRLIRRLFLDAIGLLPGWRSLNDFRFLAAFDKRTPTSTIIASAERRRAEYPGVLGRESHQLNRILGMPKYDRITALAAVCRKTSVASNLALLSTLAAESVSGAHQIPNVSWHANSTHNEAMTSLRSCGSSGEWLVYRQPTVLTNRIAS